MQARLACSRTRAWEEISLPADMGMDCGHYKWYQNQSFVELAFPLPDHTQPKEVSSCAVVAHVSEARLCVSLLCSVKSHPPVTCW